MNLHWKPATLFLAVLCCPALAQNPVRYTIDLANPAKHEVQITMTIPPGAGEHELQLPVWNALYQVRDFSQYLQWVRAEGMDGRSLVLQQLNPSRWRIADAARGARVRYQVFADNPGPYGAQLNSRHAFFNLAEVLIYVEDLRGAPVQVEFHSVPAPWKIATALGRQSEGFAAGSYDQLVDSPVEIGAFLEQDFPAACGQYRVVFDAGEGGDVKAALDRLVPALVRIVNTASAWMDDCPFHTYLFIYHISDASGGGMEHAFSSAITLPEKDFAAGARAVGISAHEFFHLWNVKRIRPQSLEPVDYTKENYTPALWFSEGVDSTAGEYIQLRAGLQDERRYLEHLSQQITELEGRPARRTQSAEQSSLDAWLEKYPYYGLPERSISYYNKGELLGVLLDLSMRETSGDRASLRELFRWMNDHYARQGKFFADSEAVREAAEAVSHAGLREFFQKYVSGVEEIPWDRFFARVGLRVERTEVAWADPGFEAVRNFDQSVFVVHVEPGGEAERAGLREGDIILRINGEVPGPNLRRELTGLAPGSTLHLEISRERVKQTLHWMVGKRSGVVFRLQDVPGVTAEQRAHRAAWLFGETGKN